MSFSGKKRFVKQYLFFYLLSLLAPMVMGILIYVITYNLEYKRVESENVWKLEQVMEKLDNDLGEAERLSVHLITNNDVNSLVSTSNLFSSDEIYGATEFLRSNSLIPKSMLKSMFYGYYIIETMEEYVLSDDMVSTLENFYKFDFQMDGMNYREFQAFLSSVSISGFYPEHRVYHSKNPEDFYLPYFHVYHETRHSSRVVMILINPRKILGNYFALSENGELNRMGIWYRGIPVLNEIGDINKDDLIVNEKSSMQKFDSYYLSYTDSKNWFCLLSQPLDSVVQNIRYIPMLILIVILTIMLVSFLFLLFLAYKSSRPILYLLDKIRQEKDLPDTGKDALSTIDFFVDQMKGRNHQLEEQISEQKTKLKSNFLISLLYDTIPNPTQISTMARHAGLKISSDPFITVLIQLKGSDTHLDKEWEESFPISLISLQSKINNAYGSQVYIVQIGLNEICILAYLQKKSREREKSILLKLLTDWVKTELQETYVLGVSQFHNNLTSAAHSFRESRAALVYNWPNNDDTINYYQKESASIAVDDIYFPREMDQVILNALRTGQTNELKECLFRLRRENLEQRKLEAFAQNILISRYKEILNLVRSSMEIANPQVLDKMSIIISEPAGHLGDFLSQAEECMISLCDYLYSDRTAKELKIAEKIKMYLEENFQNNSINLILTADSLGISSQYLTRIIKKYYGKSFRHYMEDLRMEYVRKMIKESNEPIHLLIEKCGYNSMNTFCKAFKRKYGYKASSLRDELV